MNKKLPVLILSSARLFRLSVKTGEVVRRDC